MILLSATFDPLRARRCPASWTPGLLAGAVAIAFVSAGLALAALGGEFEAFGHGLASAAIHAGFIAIGWIIAVEGRRGWLGPALRVSAPLLLASVMSRFTVWGAALFLLPPVLLLREGRRQPAAGNIGLDMTAGFRSIALGLGSGAFLGGHLLIACSLSFGYAVRVDRLGSYLTAVAYDIGANALTAEWLFRGAIFSRCWRRSEFWPAAGLSTALAVTRYVLDPALPATLEVGAGAVFYMSLLGVSACGLRAASGSLLPGYLATVAFFAAYRMLAR
jgi:hypothetical protein